MNNELNLCEILKGHEGETFYSKAFGICQLIEILEDGLEVNTCNLEGNYLTLYYTIDGKLNKNTEQDIFPSKDQCDWNKWVKEQNNKVPKTWSEYINVHSDEFDKGIKDYCVDVSGTNNNGWIRRNTPIEKSALALLKIHQLIEVGYGGNVTNWEWKSVSITKWRIGFNYNGEIMIDYCILPIAYTPIAFHTKEQAEEFLKYPENVQLLKDYFMI